MGDVNFVFFNTVKDKITEARNDDHPRIWLIDLAALIGRVRQLHRSINQTRHNT